MSKVRAVKNVSSCQNLLSFRISDIALAFFIFTTVVFNEGALPSIISKVILFVVTLFGCLRSRRFFCNGFIVAAALFLFLSILSISWSQVPSESVSRVKTFLYQFVCYACVSSLVQGDRNSLKVCLYTLVASSIVSAVWVVAISGVTFVDNRYADGFISSGQLALTSCISMMLCVFWYTKEKQSRYVALLSIFAFILLLTSSRRDLLTFLTFCLLFFSLISDDVRKRMGGFLILAFASILVIVLCLKVDFLYQFVGKRLESFFSFIFTGEGGDASTTGRSRLIDFGLNLFRRSPVIGNGIGTFESLFSTTHGSWNTSADNNYVELLSDLGVMGFAAYYIPLILFLFHTAKGLLQKETEVKFAIAGIVAFSALDFATVWFFSKCGMLMILLFYLLVQTYEGTQAVHRDVSVLDESLEKTEE